jgi:hypothetical protein
MSKGHEPSRPAQLAESSLSRRVAELEGELERLHRASGGALLPRAGGVVAPQDDNADPSAGAVGKGRGRLARAMFALLLRRSAIGLYALGGMILASILGGAFVVSLTASTVAVGVLAAIIALLVGFLLEFMERTL